MVSANLLNSFAAGNNPAAEAFAKTTQSLQQKRESDFRQGQAEKQAQSAEDIDAAIRASSMSAPAPAPVAAPAVPQGSIPMPNIQSEPLPPLAPGQGTAQAPAAPAAVSPALAAQPNSFAGKPPQQAAAQGGKLSSFDSAEFTQNLQQRLASIPGGGAQILQMKKERDLQIKKVITMAASGNVDEAKFLARQNGLEMPDVIFSNGNVANGMALSAKAYPDEPQKAQMFTQAFMQTPGGLQEKVMAGIGAGGTPTTASQRQLNNSIALLQYKAAHPEANGSDPYKRFENVANVGLVDLAAQGGPQVVISGQPGDNQPAPAPTSVPYQTSLTPQDFSVSQGLLAPPAIPGVPQDRTLFRAPVATNLATPAQPSAPQQLQPAQSGGTIRVRNPQTGEAYQIPPSDLAAAQTEGFEVVQ